MAVVKSGAVLVGDVELADDASIWYNAVLRGDSEKITVGAQSNIQENCVIHVDAGFPATIGRRVTVGHGAILHGCTIQDEVLIGMGAIVMNGAVVESHSIVAAGAVVTEGMHVPAGSIVAGCPAKVIKPVSDAQVQSILDAAAEYVQAAGAEQ
ncbi:MAG: gamma carbonic anhydrase family protein [Catenisphaera adipataccumulans]|jgi:carbonic anhydrase/acetyltransferase-like protein (isoleucine patch superfamily)|uniref:gamma carbonic anhydrase family protein n=1 Tax=Catenisphaera adipataccumulans TaxID=700500 RepID=UPI003D8AF447